MMCIDNVKKLLANKTDALSIRDTYETQVSILSQKLLDKLHDLYQALSDRDAVLAIKIDNLEAERANIAKEMASIENMIEYEER